MSLHSRARLLARARREARSREPGFAEWHEPRRGKCRVCGRRGRLLRHHVVYEQHVRNMGGDPWDLRNAMDVGAHCDCHELHHGGSARISAERLPEDAVRFAVRLMGRDRARAYIGRYYST